MGMKGLHERGDVCSFPEPFHTRETCHGELQRDHGSRTSGITGWAAWKSEFRWFLGFVVDNGDFTFF
jgi:hypothetical protein